LLVVAKKNCKMKISALIPTYNRRDFVQRAVRSILAQTVPVDEIIVVDDGSTDGTAEEVERAFGDRVRVVRQVNQGVAAARRRAILESKGEWVAFLDSDDEWTPDRNRILLQAIEKVPADVAWIFGNTQDVMDTGLPVTQYEKLGLRVAQPLLVFEDSLSAQYPWQYGLLQSSVIRRDVLVELKCFSENLKCAEDRLAGIQVACRYGSAAVPETVTRLYRTSDLSASSLSRAFATKSRKDSDLRVDYYRAEMLGFSLVADTVRHQPWGELYAESIRGLCKERSARGESFRALLFRQFRYGVSLKSVAFLCAAMLGGAGLGLWSKATSMGRTVFSHLKGTSAIASGELPK
jgi:glycosyltransferase involved in cell wall biosynthesis